MKIKNYDGIIEHHKSVKSTNLMAIEKIQKNEDFDWLIADCQSDGRGRSSNIWDSPVGGLYATRVIKDNNLNYSHISQISILSSVIVASTINKFIDGRNIKLKWPNDILIGGDKLCGILIQTLNHDNNFYIIIGFGINVKKPSVKTQGKYAYLSDKNKEVIIDKLFDELIRNFNKIINKWDYGNNFEEFRNYWMKLSSDIGKQVTVVDQKTNKSGIFEYIDESGNLILRIENDLIKINTGDVFLN